MWQRTLDEDVVVEYRSLYDPQPTIGCRLGFDDLRGKDPQLRAMNGIVCADARVEYLAPAYRGGNEVEEIPWFCTMCIRYLLRRVRMCGGEWQGHILPWFIR